MIKVIMVMENGEINSVCSPSEDDMYTDGATYGDCVAHVVPYDTDTSDIGSWYWNGTEFKKDKPAYPGPWASWENNAWVLDRERLDAEIRGQRDAVLPSGTTVADWQAYRAALRNVPAENSTVTSPEDVSWPTVPS